MQGRGNLLHISIRLRWLSRKRLDAIHSASLFETTKVPFMKMIKVELGTKLAEKPTAFFPVVACTHPSVDNNLEKESDALGPMARSQR